MPADGAFPDVTGGLLNVRVWHVPDMPAAPTDLRYWGGFGPQMLAASISQVGPSATSAAKFAVMRPARKS
jgi:hypothetical protein